MFDSKHLPGWFTTVSMAAIGLGVLSAMWIGIDLILGRRQKMAIMNLVWPVNALYMGPIVLWAYYSFGRMPAASRALKPEKKPFWQTVFTADTHCGAGCVIGDFTGEWVVFAAGWAIAGSVLWADYAVDFAAAFTLGIVFQYFAIAPMRGIHGWEGIIAAVKADSISLIAFEVGMFAWMYVSATVLFQPRLEPTSPVYWFSMQIAMIFGFATAVPANFWLLRKGLKEAM